MEQPLIWTTKGNLPVADLQHSVHWEETDDYTKVIETYTLDGEVVKQSAHIRIKEGASTIALQASL